MLFNSPEFVLIFLPCAVVACAVARRFRSGRYCSHVMLGLSLYFYAVSSPASLPLLLVSIVTSFCLAAAGLRFPGYARFLLAAGIIFHLGLLTYFKYSRFLLNDVLALGVPGLPSVKDLPIGISFFTFQQIAWMCDIAARKAVMCGLIEYSLFVVFFPQLIAGPIVHPNELIPQFRSPAFADVRSGRLAAGIAMFAIGLFKKTIVADQLASIADAGFGVVSQNLRLPCDQAWVALAAYSLQIYFDFSGYCDMAMGMAAMVGIRLPVNFCSPYKAASVTEFWRRWHITLSHFLRDYLYIPLGGNKHGFWRQSLNLLTTMVIGGLWHGAGYTFLLWGFMHGAFLCVALAWRTVRGAGPGPWWFPPTVSRALTLLAVMLAWVPFRADSLQAAKGMYGSLAPTWQSANVPVASASDEGRPETFSPGMRQRSSLIGSRAVVIVFLGAVLCLFAPCCADLFAGFVMRDSIGMIPMTTLGSRWSWGPTLSWALLTAIIGVLGMLQCLSAQPSPFLYFQF